MRLPKPGKVGPPGIENFQKLTMAEVDCSGDGGVMKRQLQAAPAGAAVPQKGEIVFTHYAGRLQDGSVFDSTEGKPHRKDGFYFKLGAGQVIGGWDVGFANMAIGEKAILACRHDYAYGAGGMPDAGIPAKATLEFEVELLDSRVMSDADLRAQDEKVAALRR